MSPAGWHCHVLGAAPFRVKGNRETYPIAVKVTEGRQTCPSCQPGSTVLGRN